MDKEKVTRSGNGRKMRTRKMIDKEWVFGMEGGEEKKRFEKNKESGEIGKNYWKGSSQKNVIILFYKPTVFHEKIDVGTSHSTTVKLTHARLHVCVLYSVQGVGEAWRGRGTLSFSRHVAYIKINFSN